MTAASDIQTFSHLISEALKRRDFEGARGLVDQAREQLENTLTVVYPDTPLREVALFMDEMRLLNLLEGQLQVITVLDLLKLRKTRLMTVPDVGEGTLETIRRFREDYLNWSKDRCGKLNEFIEGLRVKMTPLIKEATKLKDDMDRAENELEKLHVPPCINGGGW